MSNKNTTQKSLRRTDLAKYNKKGTHSSESGRSHAKCLAAVLSLMFMVPGGGYNRTLCKKNFLAAKKYINEQDHTAPLSLEP